MNRFEYEPSLARLVDLVEQRTPVGRAAVVGISGYGGSGKTTLAEALGARLDAAVVGIDEFASAAAMTRSPDWSGLDRARLIAQMLEPVREGAATVTYDSCHDWLAWSTEPVTQVVGRCVVVEGIGLLHPDVSPLLDVAIWLDVDLDTATRRGIARAQARGALEADTWTEVWAPNERDFAQRFAPREAADVLVTPGSVSAREP